MIVLPKRKLPRGRGTTRRWPSNEVVGRDNASGRRRDEIPSVEDCKPKLTLKFRADSLMLDAFSKSIETNITSRTLPSSEGSVGSRRDSRSNCRPLEVIVYWKAIFEVFAIKAAAPVQLVG